MCHCKRTHNWFVPNELKFLSRIVQRGPRLVHVFIFCVATLRFRQNLFMLYMRAYDWYDDEEHEGNI